MKTLIALLAAASVYPATSVAAPPVFLNCQLTVAPDYQAFRSQEQKDAFVLEVLQRGIAGYLLPPSETWMVDFDNKQVIDLENGPKSAIRAADITAAMIIGADGYGNRFTLNRVSGRLKFTRSSGINSFVAQGITVPTTSTWEFQCRASPDRVI
ncbi:hypothetical protein [Stenotrophomonas rhizophila]|uniref:Uncharacterized protein n=1 Tax=Stenotrophomonas rhizophila TaxID=216778 RepID=A0AAW5PNJ5_9GAMM|nr:hypothetical protein [Stenotrophomonas rhizophila]MCS4281709.1 hypothetical protein [Stenotrophomonas rhizophila]